jgi:hypothetical protein
VDFTTENVKIKKFSPFLIVTALLKITPQDISAYCTPKCYNVPYAGTVSASSG